MVRAQRCPDGLQHMGATLCRHNLVHGLRLRAVIDGECEGVVRKLRRGGIHWRRIVFGKVYIEAEEGIGERMNS